MTDMEGRERCRAVTPMGPKMADLLVAYLEQLGVEYVFGVPGGAIEPLYDALARSERRGGVRAVVARHETGAAFMADGYARNSGKLGVCCSTTGPGATNMITGVASAYENNVPMLVITAQTAISTFGKGAIQDSSCTGVNTVGLYSHCTRYNTLISHIDQFEHKLAAAIMSAMGSPAGPAHISVPRDVMAMDNLVSQTHYQLDALLDKPALIDEKAVAKLNVEMSRASNPVFIIGDEASEPIVSILSIAAEIGAKILVTPHGKGLVSPYHPQFKGVIGFAGHNSAWVLKNVAVQTKRWLDEGYSLRLAVNLSVKDLMQEDFHTKLEDLIKRSDLPPDVLELEITESTLMDHPELMIKELNKIKKMGITVAVDDFGSGYSSLNYLKKLPVDVLKIDRSFISDIESDPNDSAIVAGIIALAKNLGMSTVAEGVETEAQRKILEQLGCDTFQGYLVSKPVPPQLFTEQFLTAEKVI